MNRETAECSGGKEDGSSSRRSGCGNRFVDGGTVERFAVALRSEGGHAEERCCAGGRRFQREALSWQCDEGSTSKSSGRCGKKFSSSAFVRLHKLSVRS